MPVSRANAAYVRLAHPSSFGLYYNRNDPINPWVATGFTRWTMSEWEPVFGKNYDNGEDTRKWEFFGYTIPLYNDAKT